MKYWFLLFIVALSVICFSQDSNQSWSGLYVSFLTYEGKFMKEETTVFDFQEIVIVDDLQKFMYSRSNFRHNGKATGGSAWSSFNIEGNTIFENMFRAGVIHEYYVNKYYYEFSIVDNSGPEFVEIPFIKLFPISND